MAGSSGHTVSVPWDHVGSILGSVGTVMIWHLIFRVVTRVVVAAASRARNHWGEQGQMLSVPVRNGTSFFRNQYCGMIWVTALS